MCCSSLLAWVHGLFSARMLAWVARSGGEGGRGGGEGRGATLRELMDFYDDRSPTQRSRTLEQMFELEEARSVLRRFANADHVELNN